MEDYSHLAIISELAIAFAGFAGVFVVLRHEAQGEWTHLEKIRLVSLLTLSIPVAFFSLLPAGLAPLMEEPQQVWQVSSGISGFVLIMIGALNFPASTRITNRIPSIAQRKLTTIIARIMFLLFAIAVSLYGTVVFELTNNQFSCYYFALLAQLLMCAIIFGRILLVRPPLQPEDANSLGE